MPAAMRTPTPSTALILLALASISTAAAGCSSQPAKPPSALEVTQSVQFEVPPKQLVADIGRVVGEPPLSLEAERAGSGVVVTDYQQFPGEWNILRRWQERTRYRISVVPDWEQPDARARVEVTPETQQRPSDRHQWKPAPELHRPERAQAVLRHIQERVGSRGG